mgnify:CR=1 FL=1
MGKALHALLKERLIYMNEVTKTVSQHEDAYQLREKGTLKAFWVLISLMEQKKIERHFLAEKEEYPVRIVFVGDAEIYDILYISEAEIQLVNQLFSRQNTDGCGHVVIVENPEEIPQIQIPNVIGFCTVQEEEGGQKTAGHVESMLAEARNLLQAYARKCVNIHFENLNDMVLEAAKSSEILTEKMRNLVLQMTLDKRKYEQYQSDLVLIHGIEIAYEENILSISLPALIPHRKTEYTNYIYKPLYTAFQHWCMERAEQNKEIPEYRTCTVCFSHIYDCKRPIYRVRDHDNIEEKHVLDVISNFFLTSDSGCYTNVYHETRGTYHDLPAVTGKISVMAL